MLSILFDQDGTGEGNSHDRGLQCVNLCRHVISDGEQLYHCVRHSELRKTHKTTRLRCLTSTNKMIRQKEIGQGRGQSRKMSTQSLGQVTKAGWQPNISTDRVRPLERSPQRFWA